MADKENKPVDKAADAITDAANAQAAVADAVAEEKTAQAVVAVAGAAEATVALAKTQAAESQADAASKIKSTEEHYTWLETQMGSLSAEVSASPQRTEELISKRIAPLETAVSSIVSLLQASTPPKKSGAAAGDQPEAQKRRASDQEAPKEKKPPAPQKRTIRHV